MMPIIECQRKGRSSGISLVLGLSALGLVSRIVVADANYLFIGRIEDEKGLQEAANTFVLPPTAMGILLGLGPGEFLFRGPKWPNAALARIYPNLLPPLRKNIQYDTLPYTPSRSLREMPHVLRALQEAKDAHKTARLIPGQAGHARVSDTAKRFLPLACDMTGCPAAYIFAAMGNVSSYTQAAVRKELEAQELVIFGKLRIERTNHLLPQVTVDGCRAAGKPPKSLGGKGSPAHCVPMRWIQKVGTQRGYQHSIIEFKVPGTMQAADVAWFNEGFRDLHLIEFVHTCYTNLPDKIRAAFASKLPIEQFTIIAGQKSLLKKIDLFLRAELGMVPYSNRICFEVITPYLDAFLKGQLK